MTLREAIVAVETVYETGRLTAVDIVELNPEISTDDDAKRTVESAVQVLKAACGTNRRGDVPIDVTEVPHPHSR